MDEDGFKGNFPRSLQNSDILVSSLKEDELILKNVDKFSDLLPTR